MPVRIIAAGRQHVEHDLGGRARLEPCRAGDDLGADGRRDGQVDEGLQLGARIAGDEDDLRARAPRPRQRAAHERRHPARRDADDHVLLRGSQPVDRSRALLVVVLDALLGLQDGVLCRRP